MTYTPTYPSGWQNSPSTSTPITAASLNNFDSGILGIWAVQSGLQFLTGGGTINASTITTAQSAGFQGIFLDPRNIWDMSGLVINGVKNFIIESRMIGSIGWLGNIAYNTGGYITTSTGNLQDGVQIYASSPSSVQTQGIIFKNCVLVGSNTRAVVHFGGGQRRCGLIDCLVYNTNNTAGAYAVVNGSGLSDNNSEDNIFSFTGGGGLSGAYAALGIGVADQTQHANDTWYYGLSTTGGSYSIVKSSGGNHTFIEFYDRSNPSIATVWNHGGARLTFIGGEDQNNTGLSHLVDNSSSITNLVNRMITQAGGATTTCQVSAGTLVLRGTCNFNNAQTASLSGTGIIDLSDLATGASNLTISGSAGTLVLAGNYGGSGSSPILTSWTGTTTYPNFPLVVASGSGVTQTTTQTVTWTPPSANTNFRVSIMIHPTTAGTSTVPTIAFTERGATARNYTPPMWQQNGAVTAPSYTCAATDTFIGQVTSMTDPSGAAITVTITPTGSTFRYSVVIERIN